MITGKVSILKPNYSLCQVNGINIDGDLLARHKIFHDDIITESSPNQYSILSTSRENYLIGGVLKLKNTYTFNKGDVFEFVPINWRFPKFMVK